MINYVMLRNSDHRILGVGAVAHLSDMEDMARIKSAYLKEVGADVSENIEKYFYDGKAFQLKPPKPTESGEWVFDNPTLQWVDMTPPVIPPTLEEVKELKWAEIKKQRDRLEFGGFEFEGGVYDSDQVSQGRIMGAAIAGVDQVWTLADNTTVELSAMQLQQLYAALQAHIASVHERGRIARQLIFDAETKEQVEAVQL